MKHQFELLQVYCNFAKMVETQFSKHIKIFQSNNAIEYTQYAFQAILHSYGTSQQNSRVEQKLRHIIDIVRTLLLSAKVPAPFWSKAALYAIHY